MLAISNWSQVRWPLEVGDEKYCSKCALYISSTFHKWTFHVNSVHRPVLMVRTCEGMHVTS